MGMAEMSSSHYEALTGLRNQALNTASFLDATAERIKTGDIRIAEIISRLNDCANILRDAEKVANDRYYAQPENV